MKQIALALLIAAGLAVPAATAQKAPDGDAAEARKGDRVDRPKAEAETDEPASSRQDRLADRRAERLDLMFDRLSRSSTKRRADRIARHIMRLMARSGSPTVDLLMSRAGRAMQAKEYSKALDILDGVVRQAPDFVEGWNRRATVHYLAGNYGRSMADIEVVLRLEPRHWGALAGLSMILAAVDRKSDALDVMDQALSIHPHLEEMRERRERFAAEVGGTDT